MISLTTRAALLFFNIEYAFHNMEWKEKDILMNSVIMFAFHYRP